MPLTLVTFDNHFDHCVVMIDDVHQNLHCTAADNWILEAGHLVYSVIHNDMQSLVSNILNNFGAGRKYILNSNMFCQKGFLRLTIAKSVVPN